MIVLGRGQGPTWTTKVSDTFTEASDTALASHTPDTDTVGGGWTVRSSMTWTVLEATDNVRTGNTQNRNSAFIDTGAEDHAVEVTLTQYQNGTADNQWLGVVIRHSGDADGGVADYLAVRPYGDSASAVEWRLVKVIDDVSTDLATWTTSITLTDADVVQIRVEAIGNQILFRHLTGEPGKTYSYTLTGADATALGAGCGHTDAGLFDDRNNGTVTGSRFDLFTAQTKN